MPEPERRKARDAIIGHLKARFSNPAGMHFAFYWPIRNEPDLRRWMQTLQQQGARCALPVIASRHAPLQFHLWFPGCTLQHDRWGIAEPVGTEIIQPQVIVVPLVGHDDARYRLGFGGGYYDRTLALLPHVQKIGVGYQHARLPTIFPQPHDIPMDTILTEEGFR